MRHCIVVFGLVFLLGSARRAHAQSSVDVQLNARGQDVADALGIDLDALVDQLNQDMEDAFQTYRIDDYLRAFADAASFSNRGVGVDYAFGKARFELGLAGNLSVAAGDEGIDEQDADQPVAGFAANLSLMGAMSLERFGYPQLTLYANAFHRSAEQEDLAASITSFGVHGQLRLFRPKQQLRARHLLALWGGIDLTAGLELSRWAFSLDKDLETTLPVAGDSAEAEVLLTSIGRYEISAAALTLPVELTTSLRLAGIFWFYGGLGLDLQLGTAAIDADLDGVMTTADPNGGDDIELGTASVLIDESSGPTAGNLRFLTGLQLEIWRLRTFLQANLAPNRAVSVALGLRVEI